MHMGPEEQYYDTGEPLPLGDYRRPPIRAMPAYPGAPYDDSVYGARYPQPQPRQQPWQQPQQHDPYG